MLENKPDIAVTIRRLSSCFTRHNHTASILASKLHCLGVSMFWHRVCVEKVGLHVQRRCTVPHSKLPTPKPNVLARYAWFCLPALGSLDQCLSISATGPPTGGPLPGQPGGPPMMPRPPMVRSRAKSSCPCASSELSIVLCTAVFPWRAPTRLDAAWTGERMAFNGSGSALHGIPVLTSSIMIDSIPGHAWRASAFSWWSSPWHDGWPPAWDDGWTPSGNDDGRASSPSGDDGRATSRVFPRHAGENLKGEWPRAGHMTN